MIRCECCHADIAEPVVTTIAGAFRPGWGMCRGCWRLVGATVRREIVAARVAFKAQPHLEQSIALYWLWQLAVAEVHYRAGRRAVA